MADDNTTPLPPRFWLRVLWAALLPMAVSLWLTVPALQPKPVQVAGMAVIGEACLTRWQCANALQVGDTLLACKADLLGVPYPCSRRVLQPGELRATYVSFPSVAALFGHAATAGVLTRLERNGEVVYARSVPGLVWSSLYGGWVFQAVYWTIAGTIIWLWPRSRFARRATWARSTD